MVGVMKDLMENLSSEYACVSPWWLLFLLRGEGGDVWLLWVFVVGEYGLVRQGEKVQQQNIYAATTCSSAQS